MVRLCRNWSSRETCPQMEHIGAAEIRAVSGKSDGCSSRMNSLVMRSSLSSTELPRYIRDRKILGRGRERVRDLPVRL